MITILYYDCYMLTDADSLVQQQTDTEDKDDCYVCQICAKNLSFLNSQRRTQHVNRCIDKVHYIAVVKRIIILLNL